MRRSLDPKFLCHCGITHGKPKRVERTTYYLAQVGLSYLFAEPRNLRRFYHPSTSYSYSFHVCIVLTSRPLLPSPSFAFLTTSDLTCIWNQALHHLFPKLPRYNLRSVQSRVRALAEKHGIVYHCMPFLDANIKTFFALRETAKQVRHRYVIVLIVKVEIYGVCCVWHIGLYRADVRTACELQHPPPSLLSHHDAHTRTCTVMFSLLESSSSKRWRDLDCAQIWYDSLPTLPALSRIGRSFLQAWTTPDLKFKDSMLYEGVTLVG